MTAPEERTAASARVWLVAITVENARRGRTWVPWHASTTAAFDPSPYLPPR